MIWGVLMVDPLVARDLPGWCGRVVGLCRSEFRSLARLAVLPAVVTVGYLLALNGVRQSPEQLRARMAEMAAANGGVLPTDAAFQVVFGRLLPVLLIFGLLIMLAGLLFQGTGWFSVLRRANHEFAPMADGPRFAVTRLAALAGWSLAGGLLVTVAVGLPLLPAVLSDSGPVVLAGAFVAMLLGLTVGSGVFSVLPGVVLVERAGLGRAVALLRGRWLATGVRMLIAAVVYVVYGLVSGLLVSGVAALTGPGLISSLVQGVTVIPVMVFQLAVAVITYAELRGRADGTNTGGLAAQLVGRSSAAGSFGLETADPRSRRRWRGLRWVTPVLVLAMLAAGGPSWAGSSAGASVVPVAAVSPTTAVSPMGAVSPVLAGPDEGPSGGGESDNSAGSEPAVSAPSDVGSDSGNNSGGDSPPKVESGPSESKAGDGDTGGESGAKVATPDTPRPEADAAADDQPEPPPSGEVTTPDGAPREQPTPGTDAAAPPPPGDPATPPADAAGPGPPPGQPNPESGDAAVAAPGAVPGAQQGAQQGAQIGANPVPPGTDPNDPAAAAGTPPPLNPADPNAAANNAQVVGTCASPATCENPNGEAADQTAVSGMTNSDKVHLALDGAGMAPVLGEAADVANGIWYAFEGDWTNAGLAFGSALPGIGNAVTAGKWASKGLKAADEIAEGGAAVGKVPTGPAGPAGPAGRETLAQGENPALKSCLNSFTATTLVLMADGTRRPIKDVARGNQVLATDPVTGERGPREVTNLIRHGGMHTMVAVQLSSGGQIDATDRHPFWVTTQNKWVNAIDLKPGDVVVSDRGDQIKVTNLKTTKQDLTAYNLTVADLHTYYVGNTSVLVHNAACPNGLRKASEGLKGLFEGGSVRGRSIADIRSGLLDKGFTQGLSNNKSGYLFRNGSGEEVRIMRRSGSWDIRARNSDGNYLDEFGNAADPGPAHGIPVVSR